jgi:hypothetical protein
MSYFARKVTKRQLLGDDRDGSFGDALAAYLNSQKAAVTAVIVEGSEVTVVFHSEPKAKSDK